MIKQINKLKKQFNQPYSYSRNFRAAMSTILFISGFVFLFVMIFRSSDLIGANTFFKKALYSSYYGIITFAVASLNFIILNRIVNHKKEQNWKVKNEFMIYALQFFTISIAVYFLNVLMRGNELVIIDFLSTVLITVVVGSIPVSLHLINEEKKLLKQNLAEAQRIDLPEKSLNQKPDSFAIKINSNDLTVSSLVYIESDRNYLNISIAGQGDIKHRATLKEFGNLVKDCTYIVRCHRAFMVNTQYISDVTGNAQGL